MTTLIERAKTKMKNLALSIIDHDDTIDIINELIIAVNNLELRHSYLQQQFHPQNKMIELTLPDGRKYFCDPQRIDCVVEATTAQKLQGVNSEVCFNGRWLQLKNTIEEVIAEIEVAK